MKFANYNGKHHKTQLTVANANTQIPTGALPESSFYRVVITPELNSVIVLTKDNDIARVIPMDGSMFKDMGEVFPLLGEHPHAESIDCKAIVKEVLDYFHYYYSGVEMNGDFCQSEELTDLIRSMMIYLVKRHPIAMASAVSGPEIINKINYELMDRIEKAHSDVNADE